MNLAGVWAPGEAGPARGQEGLALRQARGQEGRALTLQQVRGEQRGRAVRAGQAPLQEVPLQLQGKQVPGRGFRTSQRPAPKVLEHAPRVPVSPSQESTQPRGAAAAGDVRAGTSGPWGGSGSAS